MGVEQKIIGIDFGTTNSLAAYMESDVAAIIPNQEGDNRTPSIVAFTEEYKVLVGEIARRQQVANPDFTIPAIKRVLGRDIHDLQERKEITKYHAEEEDGRVVIRVGDRLVRPVEIASYVFKKLKNAAENYLGDEVNYAVVTVPAYFDDLQRNDVIQAAEAAGLEVVRLINEPTAAAMAYGLHKKKEEIIAVYDFGGGTFDISILQFESNAFEVLSTNGDTYLGGDNIDGDLADFLAEKFKSSHDIDLTEAHGIYVRLKEAAEVAKCELSNREFTIVSLPFIARAERGMLHLEQKVQRSELEEMVKPYVERTLTCCEAALHDAGMKKSDIDSIILVGGSSRIPVVRESVAAFFDKQPTVGLNPDEIVAMGAAIQGGVMEGKLQEVVLLDITPHSLGIETDEDKYSIIIQQNSTIPIKTSKIFTTTNDNQTFVNIHALQGERPKASKNRSLGKFTLTDIPPAPAGVPRIRVSFFINADGILEVSAVEISSGVEKKLTLIHSLVDMKRKESQEPSPSMRQDPRRPRRGYTAYLEEVSERRKSAEEEPAGEVKQEEDAESPVPTIPREPEYQAGYDFVDADDTDVDMHLEVSFPDDTNHDTRILSHDVEAETTESQKLSDKDLSFTLSEKLREAIERLTSGEASSTAIHTYQEVIPEIEHLLEQHTEAAYLYAILTKMYLLTGGYRKACDLLEKIDTEDYIPEHTLSSLYDTVVRAFPTSLEIRKRRARFNLERKAYRKVINDLEIIYEKEKDPEWLEQIAETYKHLLQKTQSPSIKFRLIKAYFNLQELDKAIELLQDMVDLEDYRYRALKILGLCLWQKRQLVKAWQKFKLVPMDDDLCDLVYRLAKEMEDAEQLNAAFKAYQKIEEYKPGYHDVDVRLKKVNYRLSLVEKKSITPFSDLKEPRFVILDEINRGSMGVIYKARDVMLDEIVALKVLNEMLLSDESAVMRFKREAKAAKKLSHPNIVRIHDFYESGNKKFISMEFIEGTDLKTKQTQTGTLPEADTLQYLLEICDALEYAHNIGVVHRDIKPANIMITRDNHIKITDFGIAKIIDVDEMTKAGTAVIGTPLYMSPEQIIGSKIDARTDIYSLGILLYEMVSGYPPFRRGNVEYHHVHTDPPALPEDINVAFRELIMSCIEKRPEDRIQSFTEIKKKVQEIISLLT